MEIKETARKYMDDLAKVLKVIDIGEIENFAKELLDAYEKDLPFINKQCGFH